MATVPRLSGATVNPTIPQGGHQQAHDFGAGALARGAQAVAGVVNEIAQREVQKRDDAALMSFEIELANTEHELVNTGLFNQRGADAMSAAQTLWPEWEKRVGEAVDRLPYRVRQAATRLAEGRRQQTQRTVATYVLKESDSYSQAQEDGLIASAAQTASLNYMDPDRVDTEAARARLAATARADRLGLDGVARSAMLRESDSIVYQTTIERMLVDDPSMAQAYFERWGDRLTPAARQSVRSALQPSLLDQAGREIGDKYLAGMAVEADDPASVVDAIIALESGGRADATNPASSATGAGQFIDSTWIQTLRRHRPDLIAGKTREEVLALRLDPAISREMTAAYAEDNAAHLHSRGIPATTTNLYAAHHFGPVGAEKFAAADDGTPMSEILSPGQMNANPYLRGKTKAEVIANWQRRGLPVGDAAGAVAVRGGASEAEVLAAIDANVRDHRVRDAAKRRVSEQFRLREANDVQADRELSEMVNLAVENADPTSGQTLRELLTPTAYARAAAKGWIPALESRWLQRRTGEPEVSSPDTVMALEETIYRAALGREINQDALRKLNPYDPTLRLTPRDRARFADAQLRLLSGDPEKMADVASEAEINGIITRYTVDTLGIPEGQIGKPTDRGRKAWQFQVEMRTWADEFARENKRKPTYTEVLAQADLLTLQGTVQTPGLFGARSRPFHVRDLGIPNAQLQQIEEALRMEGKPVTAENIADKWRRFGGGGQ